jgi:hypothetical protein
MPSFASKQSRGEPIGSGDSRQQTAVGETPNVAARLQGLARPNQVVIDAATRRQIGGLFNCRDLGMTELKGLPAPVLAWQVTATSLARLWRDQERRTEAYDLLAPIYGWFTEGFDVLVLEEAKALLDELA